MTGHWDELNRALDESLRTVRSWPGPIGVLFSGGVDSSLLAWELRRQPGVTLWTMGREGSSDLSAGRSAARLLGLEWSGVVVGLDQVRSAEQRFASALTGLPKVSLDVLLSLALAIEGAGSPLLVCGQGVDELFLGYAHYAKLSAPDAERRSRQDLDRLHDTDWPRTQAIAEVAGKTIVAPYLSPAFERAARRVPTEWRLPSDLPKRFFREWAVSRGLPVGLSLRPKKALQYGSGVAALARLPRQARS